MLWHPATDSFCTRDDSGATDRIRTHRRWHPLRLLPWSQATYVSEPIGSRIWMARIGYTDCSGLTAVQLPEKGPTTLGTPREFGRYFSQLAKTTFAGSNPLTPGREYT
jgi:hypothetical protein